MEKFFIISPIGLEESVLQEIKLKYPLFQKMCKIVFDEVPCELNYQKILGGIELQTTAFHGCLLNYYLRGATRVLMRFSEFQAKSFPELFKKCSKTPWQKILKTPNVEIIASSKKSKLLHTKKIEKAIKEGIQKSFKQIKESYENDPFKQKVFVRIIEDKVTISLDTSDEQLYKRGVKTMKARAPIKEHLAFHCLQEIHRHHQDMTLIDPMCGSGTLLIEGRDYHQSLNKRSFAFEKWHAFQHLLYKLKKVKNTSFENPFINFIGMDRIDQDLPSPIEFKKRNVFDETKESIKRENMIFLSNLPYGKRIKLDRSIKDMIKGIEAIGPAKAIYLIAAHSLNPYGYKKVLSFRNGGIPVGLYFKEVENGN